MDLNPNLQNLSIFNWCGGCLRCRTHHPCLDSHATPWKNVSSFNLAIWSVLVLYHLNQFYISYISNSTSISNQSGWINWLGWKRLRFRWQHPDWRGKPGKLDAVTWIPKRSLKTPYSSKMLQSHPSNLAPIVPLSPHLLDLGHTFTSCRLLLGLKLRDEPICLGSKIEYYIARLPVPNMFYLWSNPRNGLKEFELQDFAMPECPPFSRSLAFASIYWAQLRKFIVLYIHRSTTSMDLTTIFVYTHDNASD